MKKYKYSIPKYFRNEKVNFLDHGGRERLGEIHWIETHYSRDHEAYHVYSIMIGGRKRHLWVAEKNILKNK